VRDHRAPASTGGGGGDHQPTTSEGVNTVTGDSSGDTGDSSSGPDLRPAPSRSAHDRRARELPLILTRKVDPDYTDVNAILDVLVTADHADGVRMELENGDVVELTPLGPGEFGGQIPVHWADNGKHTAWFTPWRDALDRRDGRRRVRDRPAAARLRDLMAGRRPRRRRNVAAIGVLPDGRPVEFGTYHEMGEPRCYLRLRDKSGEPVEFVDLLPPAHCRAIDLKIDRTPA
jgi:hypothetical protein